MNDRSQDSIIPKVEEHRGGCVSTRFACDIEAEAAWWGDPDVVHHPSVDGSEAPWVRNEYGIRAAF